MQPLKGIHVIDFTTLLPGPMATLLLAEAGAEVIKIERPGSGEEMRGYLPKFGADSVNFALLNRRYCFCRCFATLARRAGAYAASPFASKSACVAS